MVIRVLGLALTALLLSACAGVEIPSFFGNRSDQSAVATNTAELDRRAASTQATAPSASNLAAEFYSDWSALLVAADFRAATGATTDAFDNARRDMAAHLNQIGFRRENMAQLSVRPERYGDPSVQNSNYENMQRGLRSVRRRANGGCLVYLTSHGIPDGISMGRTGLVSPAQVDALLIEYCGNDPTILIVSACYSGVFAREDMLLPNRFIMTAARSDRTSFGCGEGDRYPYFDACIIETFSRAADWLDLARSVRSCVEARERSAGLSPPSAPQIYMGPDIREIIVSPFPSLGFGPPTPGT